MYTLGRAAGTQWLADNYIKESLFRIECKLNYTKAAAFDELQSTLLQYPAKYDKDKWNEAMKEVRNEDQTNEAELTQKKSSPIQYGQTVQLRHLFTRSYVTVAVHQIAKECGAQQVELGKGSEKAWLKFMPGTKTSKVGDLVRYGEAVLVMSKADQDNNFLHASNAGPLARVETGELLGDSPKSDQQVFITEVNDSVMASTWRARLCAGYRDLETKENVLKVGDMFKLFHVNSESYLTISKRDANIQLMQRLREDPRDVSLEVFLENFQENEAALCWQLERAEEFVGGPANWDGNYRLRHVLTGMYLTYFIQRGEFGLTSIANNGGTIIQVHPLNVLASVVLNLAYIEVEQVEADCEPDVSGAHDSRGSRHAAPDLPGRDGPQ